MLPEFVPNFLATLSYPPWTEKLRWGLRFTVAGEEQVPFHSYVQGRSTETSMPLHDSTFPQFSTLPTELQNHILFMCSARTLFQVMQVSSALRAEASKLFWSNPGAYFLVSADWLIDGAYPAYTDLDLDFLPYVQNLVVKYSGTTYWKLCAHNDGIVTVRPEQIAAFWKSMSKRCPSVKRVVVDKNSLSPSWRNESQPVSRAVRMLLQSAPSSIHTSAFIVEKTAYTPAVHSSSTPTTTSFQRSLYRPSLGDMWAPVSSFQPWKTIVPPAKQFNGPVGRFTQLDYDTAITKLQRDGIWPLMVEALDRHHFDMGNHEPFSCPSPTCDVYFQEAGQWTVHAAESHYRDWVVGDRFSTLPSKLRVEFEEREKAFARKRAEIRRRFRGIKDEWRLGGIEKQREVKRAWMEQFQEDKAWDAGPAPEESVIWQSFLRRVEHETAWDIE
jgi:hypothetical protein